MRTRLAQAVAVVSGVLVVALALFFAWKNNT